MRWFEFLMALAGSGTVAPGLGASTPLPEEPPATAEVRSVPASSQDNPAPRTNATAEGGLGSLDTLLPVGKSARKLIIPSLDDRQRLASLVKIDKVTRVDEEHLALRDIKFSTFEYDEGHPDAPPTETIVRLITATYHLPTKVLTSREFTRITKPGLVMTGTGLIYDAVKDIALLSGPGEGILESEPSAEENTNHEEEDASSSEEETPAPEPVPTSPAPEPHATTLKQ